jgi:hypothetical protein
MDNPEWDAGVSDTGAPAADLWFGQEFRVVSDVLNCRYIVEDTAQRAAAFVPQLIGGQIVARPNI